MRFVIFIIYLFDALILLQVLCSQSIKKTSQFVFGKFFLKETNLNEVNSLVDKCISESNIIDTSYLLNDILSYFFSSVGLNLTQYNSSYIAFDLTHRLNLVYILSNCAINRLLAYEKEIIYQVAIAIDPLSYYLYKNLGYIYESHGNFDIASAFYAFPPINIDPGSAIHLSLACPVIQHNEYESRSSFIRIVKSLYSNLLKFSDSRFNKHDQFEDSINGLRAISFNFQYLGYSTRIINELLSQSVLAINPKIDHSNQQINSNIGNIRVGIVSGN